VDTYPSKIMLATDESKDALLASRAAGELSSRSGSELHVVHVLQHQPSSNKSPTTEANYPLLHEMLAREVLEEQVERLESTGMTVTEANLRRGEAAQEIVHLSEELEVGILVLGSRGLGTLARLVLGSVSEKVATRPQSCSEISAENVTPWPLRSSTVSSRL
jgi:nucleotide-binding universal stress UspA family protein